MSTLMLVRPRQQSELDLLNVFELEFGLDPEDRLFICVHCLDSSSGCPFCTLCTACGDRPNGCSICRPSAPGFRACHCTNCGVRTAYDITDYRGHCLNCQKDARCGMCHRPHTDDRPEGDICVSCDEYYISG